MNINPDNLPSGCFTPLVKQIVKRDEIEQQYDSVHRLSANWQLLPIQEKLKIRSTTFREKFAKVMDVAWKISVATLLLWIVLSFFVS